MVTDAAVCLRQANHTGDSSLSKAGSGDVLSGILGCLLGQKLDRFEAACLAVHLHGRAGELAGKKLGMRCVLGAQGDVDRVLPPCRLLEMTEMTGVLDRSPSGQALRDPSEGPGVGRAC